jgi:hypothetical protein
MYKQPQRAMRRMNMDDVNILPIIDDVHILPITDDDLVHILPVVDDDNFNILPIVDDDDNFHILPEPPIDILPEPEPEQPIDILPQPEEPIDILPQPEEPVISENKKCTWGPAYYCQSQNTFSTCKGKNKSDTDAFNTECKAIREGMVNKCQDLGKRFWCSSDANFSYCVGSQGFTGSMDNFEACKPTRQGGRKNCKNCGRCITKIYNINSCACDQPR